MTEDMNPETIEESTETVAAPKRKRKLDKAVNYETEIVTITVLDGSGGETAYNLNELPEEIQRRLAISGLSHKLGDSAAGRAGDEAEDAINKVFAGLLAGDWSVRAPAQPKVAIKDVKENFQNLDPEAQAAAKELLEKLGITV